MRFSNWTKFTILITFIFFVKTQTFILQVFIYLNKTLLFPSYSKTFCTTWIQFYNLTKKFNVIIFFLITNFSLNLIKLFIIYTMGFAVNNIFDFCIIDFPLYNNWFIRNYIWYFIQAIGKSVCDIGYIFIFVIVTKVLIVLRKYQLRGWRGINEYELNIYICPSYTQCINLWIILFN